MKVIKRGLHILLVSLMLVMSLCLFPSETNTASAATETGINTKNQTIIMYYGDELSLSCYSKQTIVKKGTPNSYKVGYGVTSGSKDDAVIELENNVLYATGVGSASIKLTNEKGTYTYTVTVKKAPISMFLLIGQSNMAGTKGSAAASIANENGQVYSTNGAQSKLTVETAPYFVASALSGEKSTTNVKGNTKYLSDYPLNALTQAGKGKKGLDSGFAYQWNKMTGDKVWLVNAGQGSSAISKWVKGGSEYEQAVALFSEAQKVMAAEIKAGHYTLKTYGYLWLQGCADGNRTAEYYYNSFLMMHNSLKADLAYDINADGKTETLNFCDIIMPRAGDTDNTGYRNGTNEDTTEYSFFESFLDLEMRGPRVAQYYLCNTPGNDINLVSNVSESWVYMPDGTNGVKSYFLKHYTGGKVDYTVQTKQESSWYKPTTPTDVHDTIHYTQMGYNEIGIDAARNAAYTHGRVTKPIGTITTVSFYDWTGYREVTSLDANALASSGTLVVPIVYPVYESKNVTYELSDSGVSYDLYDLVAEVGTGDGAVLSSSGALISKSVTVNGNATEIHDVTHRITVTNVIEATCTGSGYSDSIYCETCKKTIKKKTLSSLPLGHNYSEYISNGDATYFADGTKTAVCLRCGDCDTVADEASMLVVGKTKKVSAKGNSTSVELSWKSVSEATSYRVYVYNTSKKKWSTVVSSTKKTSCTIKDLSHGTTYCFAVKAYTTVDGKKVASPYKTEVYAATMPVPPAAVEAKQTTTTVTLSWTRSSGATGYRIYKYNSKTKKYEKVATTTKTTYKIKNLKAGTDYTFKVKPYIKLSDGTAVWGEASKIATATKPSKPTLKVTSTKKGVASVSWSDVSGEKGYVLYYSTSKDKGFKKVSTYKSNTLSAEKAKLTSGKTYYFKVRAYKSTEDGNVYSAYSAVKAVTIK